MPFGTYYYFFINTHQAKKTSFALCFIERVCFAFHHSAVMIIIFQLMEKLAVMTATKMTMQIYQSWDRRELKMDQGAEEDTIKLQWPTMHEIIINNE